MQRSTQIKLTTLFPLPLEFRLLTEHCQHAIRTAYAFTKSDYKTIVAPVIIYALVATPVIRFVPTVRLIIWVWIHLLQFCAANQMYSQEEDAMNKPYRPIPAGLISVNSTYVLRWILAPVCLAWSWHCRVLYPGLSLMLSFIVYNELGLDSSWYSKNLLNAIGIVSWNVGAASITRAGLWDVNDKAWLAPYVSVALIWTTIHVQDFRDEAGDRTQGRVTLPTLLPDLSRYITFLLIIAWSIGLAWFWALGEVIFSCFVLLGTYVSMRILLQRTEQEDKVSLRIYMLWLCIAQTLPFLST